MKLLLEINTMYTVEKIAEYKLREEASYVMKEKTGHYGYKVAAVLEFFKGSLEYLVMAAMLGV